MTKLLLPAEIVSHNDFNLCSHGTKIKINTTHMFYTKVSISIVLVPYVKVKIGKITP